MCRLGLKPPLEPMILDSNEPIRVNAGLWERDERAEFIDLGVATAIRLKEFRPPCEPVNRRYLFVVIGDLYLRSREILEEMESVDVGRIGRRIWLRERDFNREVRLRSTMCEQRLYIGGAESGIGFRVNGMGGKVTNEGRLGEECLGARRVVRVENRACVPFEHL